MLTTLARAKKLLQITDDSQDELLTMLLEAASAEVENETGRKFGLTEYTKTVEATGELYLFLDQYPVIGTPTVTVDDKPETGFVLTAENGMLRKSDGWLGAVEIEYQAGYTMPADPVEGEGLPVWTFPADLEMVVIRLAGIALNMLGSEHLAEETTGPLRSKYLQDKPLYLQRIIDRYKRPVMA